MATLDPEPSSPRIQRTIDLSLPYSFGGRSELQPLVSRVVTFVREVPVDEAGNLAGGPAALQELLLERTEALLDDLSAVFDGAMAQLRSRRAGEPAATAVEAAVGAVTYAVGNVLAAGPTTKYHCMFTRAQELLNARAWLWKSAAAVVTAQVEPAFHRLRIMDAMYALQLNPSFAERSSRDLSILPSAAAAAEDDTGAT